MPLPHTVPFVSYNRTACKLTSLVPVAQTTHGEYEFTTPAALSVADVTAGNASERRLEILPEAETTSKVTVQDLPELHREGGILPGMVKEMLVPPL